MVRAMKNKRTPPEIRVMSSNPMVSRLLGQLLGVQSDGSLEGEVWE